MNLEIDVPEIPKRSAEQVSPAQMAHIVLRTPRFEEMKEWYVKVLDAGIAFENELLAFVTYDDEHHRIALVNMPDLGDIDATKAGVDHIAFTYKALGDLLATYKRLKGLNINPEWAVNHGPTTSMYYLDPDGTRLELQVDNFKNLEDLDAWFRTGAFIKNPIGVEINPDELCEKFDSGVPVEELLKPTLVEMTDEEVAEKISQLTQ